MEQFFTSVFYGADPTRRPPSERPANIGMIADGLAMASPYARPSAHTLEGTPTLHRVRLPVRHHPSSRLPFGHSCPIIGQ